MLDRPTPLFLFVVAAAAAGVATLGGVTWCLARPAGPPPAASLDAAALRVLAAVQLGAGVMLAVAAAVFASDELVLRPRAGGITPLAVLFVALGLAGSGAVLWCVVRLAYSTSAPAAPRGRGTGLVVVVAAVATALSVVWNAHGLADRAARDSTTWWTNVAFLAAVVAGIGGLVGCAPLIALPAVPRPGKRGGRWLKGLAGAQIALGGALTVAAVTYTVRQFDAKPWPPDERALLGVGFVLMALGFACVGGVLWCAVRVAYPPAAQKETGG